MTDEATPIPPQPLPPPDQTGEAPTQPLPADFKHFISPYRMFPSADGEPDTIAALEAERGAAVNPLVPVFDPTKPTIDQTRAAAIDAIRHNFEALNLAASFNPGAFIPVTSGVAVDLKVTGVGTTASFTINPPAGQTGVISYAQAGVVKFDVLCWPDATFLAIRNVTDGGVYHNTIAIRRSDGTVAIQAPLSIADSFVRGGGGFVPRLDINGAAVQTFYMQELTQGVGFRVQAHTSGAYIDSLVCNADAAPIAAARPIVFRTQDASGTLKTRLTIDNAGGIIADGAFAGGYIYLGAWSGGLDMRTVQTVGVTPGSVASGLFMNPGQVARVLVNGPGPITLPSNVHFPAGGPTWGAWTTIISMWCDGATIWATTTPYDA